jgi:hypothetical protein
MHLIRPDFTRDSYLNAINMVAYYMQTGQLLHTAVLALGGGCGVSLQAPIDPEYHSLHFSPDVSVAL